MKAIEYTIIGTVGVALSILICNVRSKDDEDFVEISPAKARQIMLYWAIPAFAYLWWRED